MKVIAGTLFLIFLFAVAISGEDRSVVVLADYPIQDKPADDVAFLAIPPSADLTSEPSDRRGLDFPKSFLNSDMRLMLEIPIPDYAHQQITSDDVGRELVVAELDGHYIARSEKQLVISDIPIPNRNLWSVNGRPNSALCKTKFVFVNPNAKVSSILKMRAGDYWKSTYRCLCGSESCQLELESFQSLGAFNMTSILH